MDDAAKEPDSASARASSGSGGALYLILTQIASRALTFSGNQFLLRYLSPSLLGLAVQLELLSVTVLYFARESLRVALQRQPPSEQNKHDERGVASQQVVNLSYLAEVAGLCASAAFAFAYLQNASNEVLDSTNFLVAFRLYAVATLIELISEPCFVIIQQHSLYQARARAETIAAIARCLSACMTALIVSRRHLPASVLPFAIGQLCYAVALLIIYLLTVVPMTNAQEFSLAPRPLNKQKMRSTESVYWLGLFPKGMVSLTATFYAQSIFKLLLTQGDGLILSLSTNLEAQGAFAFASNYGGLLSRLIFQPVEESSRNVFGRLIAALGDDNVNNGSAAERRSKSAKGLAPAPKSEQKSIKNQGGKLDDHTSSQPELPMSPVQRSLAHLSTILHVYLLFTLPLVALLPSLLPTLTSILLPHQWRTAETTALLTTYLYYLPFLAVNGILDAFVTCVATPSELRSQSFVMALVTAAYGFIAWLLMASSARAQDVRATMGLEGPTGSSGLVVANMVNMALRIGFSIWFVGRWVRNHDRGTGTMMKQKLGRDSLPATSCVVVAVAVGLGLRSAIAGAPDTSRSFMGIKAVSVEELGYVLGGAVALGTTILMTEHQFLSSLLMPLVPERLASKIRPFLPEIVVK